MDLEFRSDNAAGVAPEIMQAVEAANRGSALAYGADEWSERLRTVVASVFEYPDVRVYPVLTGTAANAIGLSAMCQPWSSVLCHETAHILRSEGGATSMFGAGVVMKGLVGDHYKIEDAALTTEFTLTRWGDPHHSQPSVLSLTNPTDLGTVYDVHQVSALAQRAATRGLATHMDGARLANALATLDCSAADLTWRAGVSMLSLGATKNGAMTADAIVCFDDRYHEALTYRLKRSGQVASKMRFQSIQLSAYLEDGLWLKLAHSANDAMSALAAGIEALGFAFVIKPDVNMLFVYVTDDQVARLQKAGMLFYRTAPNTVRLVTSFQTTQAQVQQAIEIFKAIS